MKRLASALIAASLFAAACGSSESLDVAGSVPDASAEEAPTTLGLDAGSAAASSEYCEIARRLVENEAPFSIYEDPEALQAYLTSVMEDVERMEEVVPLEIEADFALVKRGLDTFQQLLIDADWAFDAGSAEMQEFFAGNPEHDAASDAMDAYGRDVCGIGNNDDATTGAPNEG